MDSRVNLDRKLTHHNTLYSIETRSGINSQAVSHRRMLGQGLLTKSAVALNPKLNHNASLPNLTTDAGSGVPKTSRYMPL